MNSRKLTVTLLLLINIFTLNGQTKFFTKNGKVFFNATSSIEKIEAINEKATSIIDISSGSIEFSVLMRAFIFEKDLMQEHFNENYIESDKYPKAIFKGIVMDMKSVDINKNGTYPVKVKGMLTLHGETNELFVEASLTITDGNITAGKSQFKILLKNYKIDIPSIVKDKISNEVKIIIELNYQPFKTS